MKTQNNTFQIGYINPRQKFNYFVRTGLSRQERIAEVPYWRIYAIKRVVVGTSKRRVIVRDYEIKTKTVKHYQNVVLYKSEINYTMDELKQLPSMRLIKPCADATLFVIYPRLTSHNKDTYVLKNKR